MSRDLDFCIIGAPKCGTTSLFEYLREHPQIFLPEIKEPHYYCFDFPNYQRIKSASEYAGLFQTAGADQKIGESSVFYLYSQDAVANMLQCHPNTKIIVMLRNPVPMLQSYHAQLCHGFRETERDFEKAWNLEADRRAGQKVPPHVGAVEHLFYSEVGKFSVQLQRLFQQVDRNQVLVFLQDDLKADVGQVYQKALNFIGLENDGRTEFPIHNAHKTHKNAKLSKLIMHPPFPLNVVKETARNLMGRKNPVLRQFYAKYLFSEAPKKLVSSEFAQFLAEYFAEDVQQLSELLKRDLSHWLPEQSRQVA